MAGAARPNRRSPGSGEKRWEEWRGQRGEEEGGCGRALVGDNDDQRGVREGALLPAWMRAPWGGWGEGVSVDMVPFWPVGKW